MTGEQDGEGDGLPPAITGMDGKEEIAFWNLNIPPEQHTKECPDYLEYALTNDKDRALLSTPNSEYQRQSWDEVRNIILQNRLDLFVRIPSDLRKYREYNGKLEKEHGSVMQFVMKERLHWDDLTPKGKPFTEPDDIKILYNDWPYGIDPRIVHVVVWTKFEIPSAEETTDEPNGDLEPGIRQQIDDFVEKTFVSECGKENVIWFHNWVSLKSIHAVEHFHVMLFDPDLDFVKKITNDDVPLARKLGLMDKNK